MIRDYIPAPPFEKPTFTDGPKPTREWGLSIYTPSDSLTARMSRAMRRAAARAVKRGNLARAADALKSADILINNDRSKNGN